MDQMEIPELLAYLQSVDPEELERLGEAAAVQGFRSAAAEVPAYADLLRRRGVDPAAVADIAAFRARVPLLDKATIFAPYPMAQLCRGGTLEGIKSILPSSGHSGVFAFSVNTADNLRDTAKMVDLALEYCLQISRRKTFVVNTYPMGVTIHTSLPVANAGVNADIALGIIKKFAPHHDQLILIGQPLFAKRLVEEGLEQGVDWKALRTSVVTGGEGCSESWRTYLSRLVGLPDADRPADRLVASSLGVGELDLNLFHETTETIPIVRAASQDRALRYALFGEGVEVCPLFFVYYPTRTFVEEVPVPGSPRAEMAVSMGSPAIRNPLFRYRTGDLVKVIPYRTLEQVLAGRPGLAAPALKLPAVAVFGRTEAVAVKGAAVSAEAMKEAVFRGDELAAAVTGFFKLDRERNALRVDVQLRPGVAPRRRLRDLLDASVAACLPPQVPFTTRLFRLQDFPYETFYERKYPYIRRR